MDDPTPQDNSQGQQIHISGLNDPAPTGAGPAGTGTTSNGAGTVQAGSTAQTGNTAGTPTPPPVTGPSADDSAAPAKEYNIPEAVKTKYPELIELVKKTESMSDEEREYWFQILPIMTDEQVTRLRGILEEEKIQLAKLDTEYQQEMSKLNQKHLNEWDEFAKKKEREARKDAEASHEEEEAKEEEAILGELDNL